MIVTFSKNYLKELYETGRCSDKKHRYQPPIVKGFKKAIDYLIRATRKEDLFLFASLHFEALQGERSGLFSVRVNNQYRIEFTMTENADTPVLTICNIIELSNHYS